MTDQTGPTVPQREAWNTQRPRPKRLKWHHIYYLLAAFDLATISFSLYLNHQILSIYTESVTVNHEWADRIAGYADLAQLASAVNAPGNDVFDTRDVEGESARLHAALHSFDRSFKAAREDLRTNVDPSTASALARGLDRVDAAMTKMLAESRLIFAYFERNEPHLAGRRMAEMDRKYAHLRTALDDLQRDVRTIQAKNFAKQTSAAVTLGKYEYVIGGFIVLMVAGITLYGHKLALKMQADQKQRESFLADLQEVEARTRAILDTAADGIITIDDRETVTSFNRAAETMFGYAATEVIGNSVNTLYASFGREGRHAFARTYLEGHNGAETVKRFEVDGRRKDGTNFPMDLAISEVRIRAGRIYTAIVRDITTRKRAETLSRQYSAELEATVRERTQGLREALAKQSELAKKNAEAYEVIRRTQEELVRKERLAAVGEVAASVAHGIRNPLANIQAAAQVARENLTDEERTLAERLEDIVAEVSRLESRIRAVLDLARPFEPNLALGSLNEFIRGFADEIRKQFPETVRLTVELDPEVPLMPFDQAHMHEVLEALVINAVQAIDGYGEVIIRSTLEPDDDSRESVILSVADTGSGIEPSRIGRIFDLFYTSRRSGTGIGLSMAKRLVESNGGTIEVVSQPGQGTRFTIRFPIVQQTVTNHDG